MGEDDYSTVSMIAGERDDIGMTASSTPTGKRGTFYRMCTDPGMKYSAHYHPSTDNPNYTQEMDDRYRAELTPSQYDHEILAIFGTEESGVFNKEKVDDSMKQEYYAYDALTDTQLRNLKDDRFMPTMMLYDEHNIAPMNPFRCVGVDFDKFQAGSSILVLDYNINIKKFQVIKRIEVPRSEYSLDNAVNWIIKVNEIYNPSWIFCDRGYGDYQVERLHIYGDKHPISGLKNKVVGYQFKESIEIMDPITRVMTKEPVKQLMVNQLCLSFERDRMVLCPFDEVLHKQLIDYAVDHVSQSGMPVYTSKEEHFVDALGLAHLAFVLKFPEITQAIEGTKVSSTFEHSSKPLGGLRGAQALKEISSPVKNPWKQPLNLNNLAGYGPNERKGDYQYWTKVPMQGKSSSYASSNWGNRSGRGFGGRSMW